MHNCSDEVSNANVLQNSVLKSAKPLVPSCIDFIKLLYVIHYNIFLKIFHFIVCFFFFIISYFQIAHEFRGYQCAA